ncbi:MAG: LamG domain-containing protein [Deltaproteobacteria bacterium]|nr:LamG domain-containing protein [Deltaproteobacteria bacterium]
MDGGQYPDLYEAGTDLALEPLDYDPSLVGYWKLDEGSGSTAYDYSGHGNDGQWHGTAAGTSGYYSAGHGQSWAGYFDGSTDYIPISALMKPRNATVDLWLETNTSSISNPAMYFNGAYNARVFSKPLQFEWDNGQGTVSSGITPVIRQWNQVAVAINSSMIASIYVDGVLEATGNPGAAGTSWGTDLIGHDYSYNTFFNGSIQDIRIYNRTLSTAEIQAIYNAEK